MFADYEAYVACQAHMDQLYQVRFLGPRAGGGSPGGGAEWHIYILLSWATPGRSEFSLWPRAGWLGIQQTESHPGFRLSCTWCFSIIFYSGAVSAVPLLLTATLLFLTPWSQAAIHLAQVTPAEGVEMGLSLQSDHPMLVIRVGRGAGTESDPRPAEKCIQKACLK